jgi:hypothetical protein
MTPEELRQKLAVRFGHDVGCGGFSQLLYNLRGKFLAEVEDMLIAANAPVAHDYYVRAVSICLENKADYFRFLASDYAESNAVKHSLQLLSVEYLQRRIGFADEAAEFLASRPSCLSAFPDLQETP